MSNLHKLDRFCKDILEDLGDLITQISDKMDEYENIWFIGIIIFAICASLFAFIGGIITS